MVKSAMYSGECASEGEVAKDEAAPFALLLQTVSEVVEGVTTVRRGHKVEWPRVVEVFPAKSVGST